MGLISRVSSRTYRLNYINFCYFLKVEATNLKPTVTAERESQLPKMKRFRLPVSSLIKIIAALLLTGFIVTMYLMPQLDNSQKTSENVPKKAENVPQNVPLLAAAP